MDKNDKERSICDYMSKRVELIKNRGELLIKNRLASQEEYDINALNPRRNPYVKKSTGKQ